MTARPARGLAASSVALALVAVTSPYVFPADSAPGLDRAAAVSPAAQTTPRLPTGSALQDSANAAVAYATDRGWTTGIAVVDTTDGTTVTAGEAQGFFPTESTVKVFIATYLLAHGQMNGSTATQAYQMITRSDDAAADALYQDGGGDNVVPWAAQKYDISDLGGPPAWAPLRWGSTQISPLGMARFLVAAKKDPQVGPWLTDAMAHTEQTAADGTDQNFGLRAVDPTAPVKQGWGGDTNGGDAETTPSVGYVEDGRYAVAIYTLHMPQVSQTQSQQVTSAQAKILFGQKVDG